MNKSKPIDPLARAVATVDLIVRDGGIMILPGFPLERLLVGHFEWLSDTSAFLFPAFGETNRDGRLVSFTELTAAATGVCFVNGELIAGYLSTIDKAALEDPDDYRVAWLLWQEVWPRQRKFIERARDACLGAAAQTAETQTAMVHQVSAASDAAAHAATAAPVGRAH